MEVMIELIDWTDQLNSWVENFDIVLWVSFHISQLIHQQWNIKGYETLTVRIVKDEYFNDKTYV